MGIRKRVRAIRRAPDGSAFQTCDDCGLTVPIALADMHDCGFLNKRPKTDSESRKVETQMTADQPRSAFRFFMEEYMKTCEDGNEIEADKKGCEIWRGMSNKERHPYVLEANRVNSAWDKLLHDEEYQMTLTRVDDEANSLGVGKFTEWHQHCTSDSHGSGGSLCFFSDSYD